MGKKLMGKEVAAKIREESIEKFEKITGAGIKPKLATVGLGENPDDIYYKNSIIRNCEKLGIGVEDVMLDEAISTESLIGEVRALNENDDIHGIIIFRPLPSQIDEEAVANAIDPKKDLDCMHPINLSKVFEGNESPYKPCTADASLKMLLHNEIELEGKDVVIINRSVVVGKSLAMMLLDHNATVTICHSRTKDLKAQASRADIVVAAMGRANMLGEEYFNPDSIVIDVSIAYDEDGKVTGDVDFDQVVDKVAMITPVPGGIGSITTSLLISQLLDGIIEYRM